MAKKKMGLPLEELIEHTILREGEQPYKVPDNWVWTRVNSINQYKAITIDPSKNQDAVYELYSVPSCEYDYPEILSGREIGSSKQTVSKNDVLLCKINPRINRVWIVSKYTENRLIASSEWIIIRNKRINAKYLMFYFQSKHFREYMLSNVSGVGGSLMRAQPKFVKDYPVPISPFDEQQRIVDLIENLFEKLDQAKDLIQDTLNSFENRKEAILQKAFTGELTKKWREENGVKKDSWEEKPFEDCTILMQNGISKRKGINGTETVVLRLANISGNDIVEEDLRTIVLDEKEIKRYSTDFNDILLVRVNGSVDNVGKLIRITNNNHWAFCDHLIRVKFDHSYVSSQFVIYLSMANEYKQFVRRNMVSSAGQNTISQKSVGSMMITIPSLQEQQEIVHILDEVFQKEQNAKELCNLIDTIDLIKKSILARAFCGELGTNDPNESNAMILLEDILGTDLEVIDK